MTSDEKIKAIKYMCEKILENDSITYDRTLTVMILKSILEVCNG